MNSQDQSSLNTELSAVETYEQALREKEWEVLGPDPQTQALFHILVDHVQAASQLATEVQRLGGRPVNGTKAWDSLSHLRMDAVRLFDDAIPFGDKAALEALKEGEESGLKEYQAVLHYDALSPEVKPLIGSLKTKQQAHVRVLKDLMMWGVSIGDCAMIVTRATRVRINRSVESLHQGGRRKGNASRSSAKQGLIDDSIDKRAPGEIGDWARAWRNPGSPTKRSSMRAHRPASHFFALRRGRNPWARRSR